jgi:FAD:protein FMN transferase
MKWVFQMKTLHSMILAAKGFSKAALPVLLFLAFGACNQRPPLTPITIQGERQGTYFAITYYDTLQRDFATQIDSLLHAIDASVSVYVDTSVISRVNRNEDVEVDRIFSENLQLAASVSEASGGAFDCTIGKLIEAWGWGFSKRDSITPELISRLKGQSGYARVTIDNGRVRKEDSAITLNFNAIAQGYTSDLIARFLVSQGITSFLVDVGGELVASGKKPSGEQWKIGIELPKDDTTWVEDLGNRTVKALLTITDKGVATSGNYRKFYVENGIKYSHTIDPSTGYPVNHSLLSATVVASGAALADAWATALMVMGLEKGQQLLASHPELEAYLIYSDQSGADRTWMTDGLKGAISEQ